MWLCSWSPSPGASLTGLSQVRDEYREEFDEGRGGLGRALQGRERELENDDYGRFA